MSERVWDIQPAKHGGIHLQMDGNDIVSITGVDDETGDAAITVQASTAERAPVLWRGTVNVYAHDKDEGQNR